ncbi:MAG: succinate dehydrogenase, hydrophobic membrane anchor protein [Immundisolibacterales bacterium]|nr:succinate dehydrogenase, hydrophobic membrane anchor protein [Immundisolibacterales bacterium]
MRYRTALSVVRGAGAAKDGTRHWWAQRLTAAALVPLGIGFVAMVFALLASDYRDARAALSHPVAATLWILFAVALFHHAQLGLQVVLEDYVHSRGLKILAIVAIKFAAMALGAVSIVSILRISIGS